MHRLIGLLTALICLSLTTVAQETSGAYDFLNITSSARIYGLGGINISTVEDNLEVADQNPALMGAEMGGWIDVNYMTYLASGNFAGIKYGQGVGAHGAWLAGIQYYGYGSVQETDPDGIVLGDFSPKDLSFSGTYSHDVTDNIRLGATVKFLYNSYGEYSALAIATDLGFNYYNAEKDVSFSVVGANLGGQVKKFENISEKLPLDLRVGVTWGLKNVPLRISLTGWNLLRWRGNNSGLMRHIVIGLDLIPSSKFYLSLGYNYKIRKDMQSYQRNILSGLSLGAGFSTSRFNIGLAYAQPHTGANTLMFNFGLKLYDLIH